LYSDEHYQSEAVSDPMDECHLQLEPSPDTIRSAPDFEETLMTSLKTCRWNLPALLAVGCLTVGTAVSQLMPKPQVASLIAKVENGVDEFRDYLKRRGENASAASSTAPAQAKRAKRGAPAESQKAAAGARKDELDDALGDLNRSTNRLRRKFDATDTWMETKVQVDQVMDDARKINPVLARGSYGSEAARLWGVLRSGINDLARAYGLQPLAI